MTTVDIELQLLIQWRESGIKGIYKRGNVILSDNDTILLEGIRLMFCDMLDADNRKDMENAKEYVRRSIDELIKRRERVLNGNMEE